MASSVYYPQCRATLQVVFDGFGPPLPAPDLDSEVTMISVLPKSCTIHLTGYKEADTFDLTFDAQQFPFSPDLLRACQVQIWLFQTDRLLHLEVPNEREALKVYGTDENLRFIGLVDHATLDAGKDGQTFRLTGRDYTALMIDKQWDPRKKVPPGGSLEETVRGLVDACTQRGGLSRILNVRYNGGEIPPLGTTPLTTTLGKVNISKKGKITSPSPTVGKGLGKTKNKKGIPFKAGNTYWDVIYRLCLTHNHIVYVDRNEVVIAKPNNVFAENQNEAFLLAYGEDLLTLSVDRNIGKETAPQVRVHGYDSRQKKRFSVLYPDKVVQKRTGIATVKEEIIDIPARYHADQTEAYEQAKAYYQAKTRAESTVRASTRHLKDLGDRDLLKLRAGMPCYIGFKGLDFTNFSEMTYEERLAAVQKAFGKWNHPNLAILIATNWERVKQFQTPFYCKTVSFSFDNSSGIAVEIEGVNYVHVLRDAHEKS